jgi:alanine-synthesizing transaminase
LVDDIYIENGVSELIVIAMQALLNNGDEVSLPSPDYPLWTATVTLSGGKPVHYVCYESNDWQPNIDDIKSKISKKTSAIVIINPNNPTGAVYLKETLEAITAVALENGLIIYRDEIYDKILYDQAINIPIAGLSGDVFCGTFGGLSKNYRVAGFRAGDASERAKKSGHRLLQWSQYTVIDALVRLRTITTCDSNSPRWLSKH